MNAYKCLVTLEVTFVMEVEAEDAFDAGLLAEKKARKMTLEEALPNIKQGDVRNCCVESCARKRKK